MPRLEPTAITENPVAVELSPPSRLSFCAGVSWVTKGGLAILDQGLFAGTNFAANILLARWLSPPEYGAFALAFSVFLFLSVLHTALLTEPMMVFGPGKYLARFADYLGLLFRAHLAVTLPLSLLLFGTAFVTGRFYSPMVGWALAGATLALPCIPFLWLARRAFYVRLRPAWAAVGGAFYLLLFLGLLILLRVFHRLTPGTALAAMGGAALAVATLLAFRLQPRWRLTHEGPKPRDVAADHWRYGRWATATASVAWFPAGIYFVLLPLWFGLAEAGALKALMNLAQPVLQSVTALYAVLLPLLVRQRAQGGRRKMARTIHRFLALFLSGAALYATLLWVFRFQVLQLCYAGKYTQYAFWPLLLVAVLPIVACANLPFDGALRAIERPDLVFRSYASAAVVSLICGVPLAAAFGISGALGGMIIFWLATGLLNSLFYTKQSSQEKTAASESALEAAPETS